MLVAIHIKSKIEKRIGRIYRVDGTGIKKSQHADIFVHLFEVRHPASSSPACERDAESLLPPSDY